jgi:hypothetical protein
VVLGVEPLGVAELVFESDDAAGGVQGGAVVEQGPEQRVIAVMRKVTIGPVVVSRRGL